MEKFTIIDRRGQGREEEAEAIQKEAAESLAVAQVEETSPAKRSWKGITYTVFPAPILNQQGQQTALIMVCRAIGLRSDGFVCVADWALPQEMPEGFDCQSGARERIKTYLKCACVQGVACVSHRTYIRQWMEQDNNRLILSAQKPVSAALEAFAEAAQKKAQSKIVMA